MKFLRIHWTHGRELAEQYRRERKLLKFAIAETGEMLEGFIIAFHGEVHAMIEVQSRIANGRKKPLRAWHPPAESHIPKSKAS